MIGVSSDLPLTLIISLSYLLISSYVSPNCLSVTITRSPTEVVTPVVFTPVILGSNPVIPQRLAFYDDSTDTASVACYMSISSSPSTTGPGTICLVSSSMPVNYMEISE